MKMLRLVLCALVMVMMLAVVGCKKKTEIPEEAQGKSAEEIGAIPPATAAPGGAPTGGMPGGQMPPQAQQAMEAAKKAEGVQ